MMDVIYTYDGTFEGILCCIFTAYTTKIFPKKVQNVENLQQDFTFDYINIETDENDADRVYNGILKKSSYDVFYKAYCAYLADYADKETYIFKFLCLAFKNGGNALRLLQDENVMMVERLSYKSTHEAHILTGFLRFEELENELYYAEIEPTHNVLEILANHFSDRFPNQKWIICDKKRNKSAVYNGDSIIITLSTPANLPSRAENEKLYQKLWKQFYDTIEIKERKNPKLQRSLMPKKYWRYMTETKPGIS